ncbi:sodium-dependent glucose transporter 1 [Patella vulgata]|uniref:sodium-dependent glucose transporter 1 n=1 Tax=Patella vulgata TaxID=6465 RepID=UPI0021804A75|nr:sodium-dependent glucose transporter 1 [Patella vulgata]
MVACPRKSPFERWADAGYRTRLKQTIYLLVANIAMGFISAQKGAAFLDIRLITNTSLESASFFFTAYAVGGVVGALVFGGLYDKFNRNLLLYLTVLGMSVTVVIIPYCTAYEAMLVAWFCNAFFKGGFDASSNAEVVRMWDLESQPYLFLNNLGFSIGAVFGPLVTEPFLVPKELVNRVLNSTHVLCSNGTNVNVSTPADSTESFGHSSPPYELSANFTLNDSACSNSTETPDFEIRLHYAYAISGALAFITSFPLLYQTFRKRKLQPTKRTSPDQEAVRELPIRHYIIAIIIIILTFVFNNSIEDAFSSFLMTFVVKQLNWSKTQGAQLSSLFFGMYVIVRALGIFFADLLSPTLLLFGSLAILLLSIAGLTISSIYSGHIGVWICVAACGFIIGVLFPIGVAWINKSIVSVSGKMSSIMLMGSATGRLCNPIVLGYFMEKFSPLWFCYLTLSEAAISITIFVMSTIYSKKVLSTVRRRNTGAVATTDALPLNEGPATANG